MIVKVDRKCLEDMLKIERECFSEPWTRSMFVGEFESQASRIWGWVDAEEKTLLGYLVGWLVFEEFHIANLAVRTEARRKGIAKSLLAHALGWALEHGAERSLLEVRASNEAALSLYRAEGFSLLSVRPHYYRFPTEDALVLHKRLCQEERRQA